MNPTTVPNHMFVNAIPLVRALSFGLQDLGGAAAHYRAVESGHEAGEDHPLAGAQKAPHPIFLHPRVTAPPDKESPEQLRERDLAHRNAALMAIPREVASELAELSADVAAQVGLCPVWFWEDEPVPAVPAVTRDVPAKDANGNDVMVTEILRPAVPATVRPGVRSFLKARAKNTSG
jgi:hypothetical protein